MPSPPIIEAVTFEAQSEALDWLPGGKRVVHARFSDGASRMLWSYYTDELAYDPAELIGLTERAAWDLHHARDVMRLNSQA